MNRRTLFKTFAGLPFIGAFYRLKDERGEPIDRDEFLINKETCGTTYGFADVDANGRRVKLAGRVRG